jgi:hypothetical protein
MTIELKAGVRYRMPAIFGPAPGPRQKADGTRWKPEETGTMHSEWMTVSYLTRETALTKLLPPGFALRGDPVVSVSLSFFNNLYWLAGRGYGIVYVDFPVVYSGKTETIAGAFCAVLWEGIPDAIMTGREELGFPKLFADIPPLKRNPQRATAGGEASWFGHWRRATFEQLPTTFHIVNGLADLPILEYVGVEMVEFSAPGIAVSANSFRAVEPAD